MKKSYIIILIIVFVLVLLFLYFPINSEIWKEEEIGEQLFAAMAGAVVVAVITQVLLTSQTDAESKKEQNVAKFSEKLRSYNCFLNTLNEIVQKEELSEEDEANIQFQLLNVNLHTTVENSLIVCKNLNNIIRKLKVKQPIEPNFWKELLEIGDAFHNELYQETRKDEEVLMPELDLLRIPKQYRESDRVLSFIQDGLSLYPDYIISKRFERHLRITIPILPKYKNDLHAENIILIVKLSETLDMEGFIYFTTDGDKKSIQKIIDNREYLHYNRDKKKFSLSSQNVPLGTNVIENLVEYTHLEAKSSQWEYLRNIYGLMDLLKKLWWEEGVSITRIGKDSKEQLLPGSIAIIETKVDDKTLKCKCKCQMLSRLLRRTNQ